MLQHVFEVVYSGRSLTSALASIVFGGQSVHNLILGKTEEGYVTFLSPWNDRR